MIASDSDFELLVQAHKDAVYRQMIRVCGNYDDAEDVLIEALLRAYQCMGQLEDKEKFQAWLATIGRRICTRIRHRDALLPIIRLSEVVEPGYEVDDQVESLHLQLTQILDTMPPTLAGVYQLREVNGLSGEETARQLNISLEAMKSRLGRARAHVRMVVDGSFSFM